MKKSASGENRVPELRDWSGSDQWGEELIGELQKAVVELTDLQKRRTFNPGRIDQAVSAELLPEILERLATLEAQALEQEQALKHILTMLIDWIENGSHREAA